MVLRVIRGGDTRNDIQKALDAAVRSFQEEYGADMDGFALVVWPKNLRDADSAYECGQVMPELMAEFVKQRLEDASFEIIFEE